MKKKNKAVKPTVERSQYGERLHADKPTKNGHYMGKHCGFDYKDGRYHVAPSHYQLMENANEEELGLRAMIDGLRAMIDAHNAYLGQQFKRVALLRQRFWDSIRDDYEIEGELLYHGDGWVSVKPKDDKTA